MTWIVTKYLITALMVVLVSEAAKHGDRIGGIVAALPIVTALTLIWLHIEHQPGQKIANHAWYTFWYVIPTLPMFLAFPSLLPRLGFWGALVASALITAVCFWLFSQLIKQFGIDLSIL